jgi:hypothetical protein
MSTKAQDTFPRKEGESLTDWTLRWLVDAEMRCTRELDLRVEAAPERDVNTYVIEEYS